MMSLYVTCLVSIYSLERLLLQVKNPRGSPVREGDGGGGGEGGATLLYPNFRTFCPL